MVKVNLWGQIFGALFLFWHVNASCQNMPPPAHSNSPYYVPPGAQSGNGVSTVPQAKWADRWGAIAVDFDNRIIGTITDETSKRKASLAATKKCQELGGKSCKIKLAYYNQCAAMVTGLSGYTVSRAETEKRAGEIGMDDCGEKDTQCEVFYSGCSLPVQVQ